METEAMGMATRKYNPGFLSDDEIVASFCVRTNEFDSIVEILRDCHRSSNPHQMVIGPRGFGKTSLLLRIAVEIQRNVTLSSHLFPIVFSEESYEISTAGEFWLECLSRLAIRATFTEDEPDLNRTYDELRTISDDQILEERCLGTLLDFSDRQDKRLVLLIENLNGIFRDMIDPDAGWRLRKILQTEPRIILLASATSRFDQIDNPDQALYDLFRITPLHPLEIKECATLWETVSGRYVQQETIRALRILTGGNPRLIMIVARFGASLSFRNLITDLFDLVDDHTEYFRSHLEALPAQERRVYLALADLWKPATTREISDRARLDTNKCSAQLARLIERGIVENAGGTTRRKQYYLTERMYNIYYLLRRPRGSGRMINLLILFMESFYSPSELREIGLGIAHDALTLHDEMRVLYKMAFEKLITLPALADHRSELRVTSAEATGHGLIERGFALRDEGRLNEALSIFDEVISQCGEKRTPFLLNLEAQALIEKGEILWGLNRMEDALATYEKIIHRYGTIETPILCEIVALALLNKGITLHELKRPEEAIAANDEVVRRYGKSKDTGVLATVAMAFCQKAIMLTEMSRLQEAMALSDELIHRFEGNKEKHIVVAVATTLCNKGTLLRKMNRPEEELDIYDEVVHRYGASKETALKKKVAQALLNKAATLVNQNRPNKALAAFDEVLRSTAEKTDIPVLEAKALFGMGNAFYLLNRPDEALAAYDDVVQRFGESQVPSLGELVVQALAKKVFILNDMDRQEESCVTHEELVRRMGSDAPKYHELIECSLIKKAEFELTCGRYKSAILALERCHPRSVHARSRVHFVHAEAILAEGNTYAAKSIIKAILKDLPKLGKIPRKHLSKLMELSIQLGSENMRQLVEASPSADILLPLATALAQEQGLSPRVAREVEDVAHDIRKALKVLKKQYKL